MEREVEGICPCVDLDDMDAWNECVDQAWREVGRFDFKAPFFGSDEEIGAVYGRIEELYRQHPLCKAKRSRSDCEICRGTGVYIEIVNN